MKQKHDVSIAGIAFQLDDEGYVLLDNYLSQIAAIYNNNPDGAEVLADIEGRICELILDRQPAEQLVSVDLIRHIIEQLGMPDPLPEETTDSPAAQKATSKASSSEGSSTNGSSAASSNQESSGAQARSNSPTTIIPRRLYRNPENARIGGVCSGLGTFFRVDPIVFRLCFLLPLPMAMLVSVIPALDVLAGIFGVLFAISIPAYLLLWFAIPMARTPRQKLEMRGEAITATAIQKSMQSMQKENRSDAKRTSGKSSAIGSASDRLLQVLGYIILFIIKFVGVIIAASLLIGGISLIAVTCIDYGGTHLASINMFGTSMDILIDTLFLPITIAIPLIAISYLMFALIFKWPAPKRKTLSILTGIWLILVIFATIFVIRTQVNRYDHHDLIELITDQDRDQSFGITIKPSDSQHETDSATQIMAPHTTIRVEKIKVNDSVVSDTIRTEYFLKK